MRVVDSMIDNKYQHKYIFLLGKSDKVVEFIAYFYYHFDNKNAML
jgi:hypothetical protein